MERSNRETIERLGGVPVHGAAGDHAGPARRGGGALPLDEWLDVDTPAR